MKLPRGDRTTRLVAILAAAAPFAFAVIRLLQTHADLRPMWMAIAACLTHCTWRSTPAAELPHLLQAMEICRAGLVQPSWSGVNLF